MGLTQARLQEALQRAAAFLCAGQSADGVWTGELSSSALSTATAVIALKVAGAGSEERIERGLHWLFQQVNADGGWGDTADSPSNLSTTILVWAAFGCVAGADVRYAPAVGRARHWIAEKIGLARDIESELSDPTLRPATLERFIEAVLARYGKDRTFSIPILTACALAGRLGPGRGAWRKIPALPFELAACPHSWFAALRLPMVSYALPALIAIGQARHVHCPTRQPLARLLRQLTRQRTLEILRRIQPSNGGFLEATPLTAFVTMSLAGSGQGPHPVVKKGVEFLRGAQRADGSWPIDTNLSTWVTTLALNALGEPSDWSEAPGSAIEVERTVAWLLAQQGREEHFYSHAAPGGWGWTPLPGGVPDADDTAGAVLALARLLPGMKSPQAGGDEALIQSACAGLEWLLNLQNRDGGIPTFCRGWGALPFDRSSPDLTAHVLRAWQAWKVRTPVLLEKRLEVAQVRAVAFLLKSQRRDGAWVPLWFGNQHAANEENPVYGTARVLRALAGLSAFTATVQSGVFKGLVWLLKAQNEDGGWGGAGATPSSVEETALVVEALAGVLQSSLMLEPALQELLRVAVVRGAGWLVQRVESGLWTQASPIGLYFARLWYSERLYPQVFTVGALLQVWRVRSCLLLD